MSLKQALQLLTDALYATLLAVLIWVLILRGGCLGRAPAPFPRTSKPRPLTRERLAGTWKASWGTVPCEIILKASGDYVGRWPGTTYVGSWGLDREGRLWITETSSPQGASSWQSYAILINPRTLQGPVVVGASGVVLKLEPKR